MKQLFQNFSFEALWALPPSDLLAVLVIAFIAVIGGLILLGISFLILKSFLEPFTNLYREITAPVRNNAPRSRKQDSAL
jgi:hypothetical protein